MPAQLNGVFASAGTRVRPQSMSCTSQDSSVSIVYVTVPVPGAENLAKKLAGSLVECKLAACLNIVPGSENRHLCLESVIERMTVNVALHAIRPCQRHIPAAWAFHTTTHTYKRLHKSCPSHRCHVCLLVGRQSRRVLGAVTDHQDSDEPCWQTDKTCASKSPI